MPYFVYDVSDFILDAFAGPQQVRNVQFSTGPQLGESCTKRVQHD